MHGYCTCVIHFEKFMRHALCKNLIIRNINPAFPITTDIRNNFWSEIKIVFLICGYPIYYNRHWSQFKMFRMVLSYGRNPREVFNSSVGVGSHAAQDVN